MSEYEHLQPYVKEFFEDLKIEKTDENVEKFSDFFEKIGKDFGDIVIEKIKEEFGSYKY